MTKSDSKKAIEWIFNNERNLTALEEEMSQLAQGYLSEEQFGKNILEKIQEGYQRVFFPEVNDEFIRPGQKERETA